jgi:hypothetical protein
VAGISAKFASGRYSVHHVKGHYRCSFFTGKMQCNWSLLGLLNSYATGKSTKGKSLKGPLHKALVNHILNSNALVVKREDGRVWQPGRPG